VTDVRVRELVDRAISSVGGPRRLMSAVLVAVAVVAALHVVRPAPPAESTVWVAAHDLAGGAPLGRADVRPVRVPVALVPAGALRTAGDVVGRLLAAPVRRGEPLTDDRMLGDSLLASMPDPGLVAVPVRVADGQAAVALVHPGDVVDVLAATDPGAGAADSVTVARGVQVLSVPGRDPAAGDGAGLVVVAVDRAQAAALARASVSSRLSLALRHP
jgi:Flp pilus assembly protein CpaB